MGSLLFGFILLIVAAVLLWLGTARWFGKVGDAVLRFLKPFKGDKNPEEEKNEKEQ